MLLQVSYYATCIYYIYNIRIYYTILYYSFDMLYVYFVYSDTNSVCTRIIGSGNKCWTDLSKCWPLSSPIFGTCSPNENVGSTSSQGTSKQMLLTCNYNMYMYYIYIYHTIFTILYQYYIYIYIYRIIYIIYVLYWNDMFVFWYIPVLAD